MALNKSWSLKDKLAGVSNPKEITNEEIKEKIKEIKKTVEKPKKSK